MSNYRLVVVWSTLGAILLFTVSQPLMAQRKLQRLPASLFGTWRIYRFEEVGGHVLETAQLAQKEIGRAVRFAKESFTYDKDFLSFGPKQCPSLRYKFEIRKLKKSEIGQKGTLEFYGLEPSNKGEIRRIVVICDGHPAYYFEFSKGNQLSIYYDGWFFFLEKVR